MSTNSIIGIMEDGTIKEVRCHWDGKPAVVGKTLFDHYNTYDRVIELISYGDIVEIRKSIGEKTDLQTWHDDNLDQCLFFIRDYDRDVSENEAREYDVHNAVIGNEYVYGTVEWVYMYIYGEWFFAPRNIVDIESDTMLLNAKPLIRLTEKHIEANNYFIEGTENEK